MAPTTDPTESLRNQAASMPSVASGTSCNQSSFRVGKTAFLFVGPGPKGQGYKAMFKLDHLRGEAAKLSAKNPQRVQVGSTGWVTTRFTADDPLPRSIWGPWLEESYAIVTAKKTAKKKKTTAKKKTIAKKKTTAKKK
ncbi:MAG: hypothetical protein K0V04_06285, partial [Deltaproteobacteria bacterium]|nr:hypothetical protein [Deltaproteobacteria bacterium]